MADLRISQLPPLTGAILQADDELAIVDGSASETKKITSKDLVQSGIALIDAGSIPGDKLNVTVPAGSIGTDELADGAVTAAKLANNSTAVYGSSLPATGAYQGQLAVLAADGMAYIWSGSAWTEFGTGITSVIGGQVGNITTTATTVDGEVSVLAQVDNSTVPAAFLAGPTASAGSVELRTIVPADLPIATTTTAGIVTVPSGGGLTIDGGASGLGSDLVIDNDISPSSDNLLVAYDAKGLVIGGRAIQGGDLPIATNGSVGAISAGPEFAVTPAGQLQIRNQVTAAGHPFVEYDENGFITSGRDLTDTEIPDLDASKITTGTFPTALLADGSVTRAKLADYGTCYIQEVQPPITGDDFIGVGWYQESTGQLRLYNGNSWMPVGFGRLSNDNLRWGGIVDAATGFVTGVTDSGQNAGLTIGQPLPEATNALGGLYVVIGEPGDQIAVTPGVTYDAGDWCLCINENEGWVRIDTMTGGGSGGASTLNDLLDVTISGGASGQYLQLQANGQWQNVELTADVESVNGQTGVVVLGPGDIGAATEDQGALADTALQPGDPISQLTNDSGFITAADIPGSPVLSVNGQTGEVVLDASDVGALPDSTSLDFVPLNNWSSLPDLGGGPGPGPDPGTPTVTLTSTSFTSGGQIGAGYRYDQGACGGQNTNPQLSWQFDDLPDGATITSWEVSCIDTDASDFVHWTVTDIPANQTSIAENGGWEAGAVVGPTGYDPGPVAANGWGGPCPPPGEEHTYTIIVTARYNDGSDKTLSSDALTFLAATGTGGGTGGGGGGGTGTVTVTSTSFTDGGAIDLAYYFDQCGGSNTSPQLSWSATGLDAGRSVTEWQVTCVDVDAQGFVHWAVGQIPAAQTDIAENGSWQPGAQVAQNGFGAPTPNGWGGPCPPELHNYQITVRATLDDGSTIDSTPISFQAS